MTRPESPRGCLVVLVAVALFWVLVALAVAGAVR